MEERHASRVQQGSPGDHMQVDSAEENLVPEQFLTNDGKRIVRYA